MIQLTFAGVLYKLHVTMLCCLKQTLEICTSTGQLHLTCDLIIITVKPVSIVEKSS